MVKWAGRLALAGAAIQIAYGDSLAIRRPLIAGLSLTARFAGRRRLLERHWPPDLPRPW
jgi:hypothetical protein